MSQDKSSQPYCHMTNHHTNKSQDKSSQGLIVKGQMVTGTFCLSTNWHTDISSQDKSLHGHIFTTDILSQDKSSHEHIVTRYIVTRTGMIGKQENII